MSLPTRACLAMALAWAGGFGLPGAPGSGGWWGPLAIAAAIASGWWLAPAAPIGEASREPSTRSRASRVAELFALALVLALLARTLGRVIVASPAALYSVPVVGLALVLARSNRRGSIYALTLALAGFGLGLGAAMAGASLEARGPQARGAVLSGPVLGIHPRQAVAVKIDGYGPHDIIVDDFVDPPGGLGYDPIRWAARLELELHAIAQRRYADGPARAREAFARATVEARESVVVPAERDLYDSLLGVEVRSGTLGEGSRVEFVCPGQAWGPERALARGPLARACPRKYLVDGSTGLGLSPRWPGYTEVRGRDRARLARALGWPTGEAAGDRRRLALESGAWLLIFVFAAGLTAWLTAAHARTQARAAVGMIAAALIGLALLAVLAPADPGFGSRGGPTWLAIWLILLPAGRDRRHPRLLALACALLLGLIAGSPLAGRGDAIELLTASREALVALGLDWATAGAIAGAAAVLALGVGLAIAAATLVDRAGSTSNRERRHVGATFGLALALGVGLALRKPGEDLALLQGAAAVLLLASVGLRERARLPARARLRPWAWQAGLTGACALAAAAPILHGLDTPGGLALVGIGSLLCVVLGILQGAQSDG